MGPALCLVLGSCCSQNCGFPPRRYVKNTSRQLYCTGSFFPAIGMGYKLLHPPLLTESFPGPCPVSREETESPDSSGEELEERG